ncbi:phosphoenolpyruvate carboxylase [Anaeromyxobacter oryzae]|uniref:Phosphoenolpyruvate carboxylase n=1 Tax=Anaeromyxobacter oryzae TaxID=2918170 RepID=A0ABN6MWS7_9BACT|nr:phosphoenolpyruvate carboxylase [Anaeromyxobacter oryzae]BDG05419.1 phosphoenolpyruvate carboxylase [Anaeromyxobacter oryzae]
MAEGEQVLQEQIRQLGRILGETISELSGPGALELVERVRQSAVALRQGRLPGGRDAFAGAIRERSVPELALLAEAFTDFFHLINSAEEQHRARAIRARDRLDAPIEGSVAAACEELRGAGATAEDVQALLDRMLVMPVLTAHPTEARRRTVLDHLAEVAAALDRLDDPRGGDRGRRAAEERLREVVTALAATRASRTARPTPYDEVRAGLLVFERTLLDAVPAVYRSLADALAAAWPGVSLRIPPFLRFGTWIGGDRDGNPFVTADVTRAAFAGQRATALARHAADARALWRELSAAAPAGAAALEELEASIAADRERLGEPPSDNRSLRPDERFREKLRFVAARLEASRGAGEGGYADARAYQDDLELLQRALSASGLQRLARGRLEDVRRRAEVFGFHLATLDVRQHSDVHARAVDAILAQGGLAGYAALPEARRVAVLGELLARPSLPAPDRARLPPEARDAVETLVVVGRARRIAGPEACERYVVSFTSTASDLLEVLLLARAARLAPDELRPVPLLEQLEDLEAAGALAEQVLSIPPLRAALRGELEVMVGYSDSGKQVGYVPSRVALHKAQLALAQVAESQGVTLTVFHGRGGAVGRGGGPANRAIRAQPRAALRGRFRVTEQGETIAARYGRMDIARRDLEQMVNAVLVASFGAGAPAAADAGDERERRLERAAAAALDAYRGLVADPDRLARYALAATPMAEVPELRFASRPASRTGKVTLEALRAIPWVFSWNQSRHGLPGWFGLGTALAALVEQDGLQAAQALYREWPLVRALVDDARLALTQADLDVAAQYARLAAPADRDVFDLIAAEHRRTVERILEVTGDPGLMTPWPAVARAAARRNPYVDVLSHVQIELLARLQQEEGEARERVREALLLTVNGIAAGLQTVG